MKAAKGNYIGWIHADLQTPPEELVQFFDEINSHKPEEKLFLKECRTNRSVFDQLFTNGQSVFNSCLFGSKIYDVGAIPVLFSRSLISEISIDDMANDFSIELYVYKDAYIDFFMYISFFLWKQEALLVSTNRSAVFIVNFGLFYLFVVAVGVYSRNNLYRT